MNQDELKQRVGQAAAEYVLAHVPEGAVLGVGTGSTANCFIDAIAPYRDRFAGALSSSSGSTHRLQQHGFTVLDPNDVDTLPIYVDGADEIDPAGNMIKGGGGALTREKIIASIADLFICIADESKRVPFLGTFALPVEVVPMAREVVSRKLLSLGGTPSLRKMPDGSAFVTDNGHQILDTTGLVIHDPLQFECLVNGWPGVLTTGVFSLQHAHLGMFGTTGGIEIVDFSQSR